MSVPDIGNLVNGIAYRDAIHVAVVPVIADCKMWPGEHVGLLDNGKASAIEHKIGVVDPFLKEPVKAGDRFWLFLYPNTITDLRHVWTHPAFKAKTLEELTNG